MTTNIDHVLDGIAAGKYPDEPLIDIPPPFSNDAGLIWNVARGTFGSASFIKSRAGAIRSNHYHRTDSHFIYVVSGVMYYYWKKTATNGACDKFDYDVGEHPGICKRCWKSDLDHAPRICERVRVGKGQLVFTPPLVVHATYFPVDCEVVTLNGRNRDHASHEEDLVRVPPVLTNEVCPAVAQGVRCCLPYETERDFPTNPIHCGTTHESVIGQKFSFGFLGSQDGES